MLMLPLPQLLRMQCLGVAWPGLGLGLLCLVISQSPWPADFDTWQMRCGVATSATPTLCSLQNPQMKVHNKIRWLSFCLPFPLPPSAYPSLLLFRFSIWPVVRCVIRYLCSLIPLPNRSSSDSFVCAIYVLHLYFYSRTAGRGAGRGGGERRAPSGQDTSCAALRCRMRH